MKLSGRTYAVLVAEGVEDLEYWVTVMRLQEEGATVVSVGSDTEPHLGKNGLTVRADVTADGFDSGSVDGLVIPGGHAPDKMRRDPAILDLVRDVHGRGLPIGIICHGGSVAISAGIVGERATGSLGIKDDLVLAGAEWVDEPAFRDGQIVWGRVVADIPDFQRELVALFAEVPVTAHS
ncbi:MAG TPA: type 1 glutamine amidotransferase domain-containing protein [Miltoncostaeaceae bacterium]|jgi:protease I|nr:type 1 glutamine amidotransferase domain-containing protein [Miltoncostaeaceae bacterium]